MNLAGKRLPVKQKPKPTLRICHVEHLEVARVALQGGRGDSPGLAALSSHSRHSSPLHRDLFVPSSFVFSEELAGLDPFVPFDFFASIELISLWASGGARGLEMPNILIAAWGFEVVEEDYWHGCGYSRLATIYF